MPETGQPVLTEALLAPHFAERPAVQADTLILSYAQLRGRVASTINQLRSAGVDSGDRVLVLCPNGTGHIIAVLAVIACGAIAVPLDPAAKAGRLRDATRQTRPRCCLVENEAAAPAGIKALRLSSNSDMAGHTTVALATISPDQPALIRFTSGSSGHAKGVVLTQTQQLWTASRLARAFGLDSRHRELVLITMSSSGGWQRVAATLLVGGCVIIGEPPLSIGSLLDDIVATRATGFFTPPPLVRMLLAAPADRVRKALLDCRNIEIGSAALSTTELNTFLPLVPNARVFVHYGLTECSRAAILDTRAHPDRLNTVGTALPGVTISIRDEDGNDLPAGLPGEIHLRSPHLATGYWEQPDLNQRFVNGWLATGDHGHLDADGFLTLLGRHDDLINCGGHCYFPAEVEQLLGTPSGVEQYLVAGVADPRGVLQEVPWAFVVPIDATSWTPEAFLALARGNLPGHMVPRHVVTVPRLPLTASGKPDRLETVKLYAATQEVSPDG